MSTNKVCIKKAKDANLKFFSRKAGLFLFAALQYKFKHIYEDLGENVEGMVKWDIKDPNSPYNGHIYINEKMVEGDDYSHNNLIWIILHELFHILHKHGSRRGTRDPMLWNVAADHTIERDLKHMNFSEGTVVPHKNKYNIVEELHKQHPDCTAEQAYTWLLQNKNFVKITKLPNGAIKVKESGPNGNNEFYVTPESGGQDGSENSEEKLKGKQIEADFVSTAAALYNNLSNDQKGNISSNAREYLDKLLEVKIPWNELLEKAIKKHVVFKPDDRAWNSPNKFYHHLGLTLPGTTWTEEKDGTGMLIISVDTSGSVGPKDLKEFAHVVSQSMKYFEIIKVITHDVCIHQIKDFTKDQTNEFETFIKKEGFKGRGGTSHEPTFKYIEKEVWKNFDLRDDLSMYISLTDLYSDVQNIWYEYDWIKNNIPCVFIVPKNEGKLNIENKPDSMIRIEINSEEIDEELAA